VSAPTTPAQLLQQLATTDPTRPRLTWYDDAEGPTRGERIELSGRVLGTWSAKAASLLADDLDVERGGEVALQLPAHWRAVYWALAAWRVGASVSLDADRGADVLVTDRPGTAPAATRLVAVSLPALARTWTGPEPLPSGCVDEAADVASHPDVFEPLDEPQDGDGALRGRRELTAAALLDAARELARAQGWSGGERVAVVATGQDLEDVLLAVLGVWQLDGSVVLVRASATPTDLTGRWASERVTSVADPAGRPASRS
jgi:uncharacterized protein (TIGR03089 family)